MKSTLEVQAKLKELGFDPGPLDGVRGRLTIAAVIAFQLSVGLETDGLVGPLTLKALFPELAGEKITKPTDATPWLSEAIRNIGLKEGPGNADNPLIIGWGKRLRIVYDHDAIPWCGLFTGHCVGSALPSEALPANVLGAKNWRTFGVTCRIPQPGAILVFWRGDPQGPYGHVGFYWAEDQTSYHVLGGNQSDSVSITRISKTRYLEARWPKTALAPTGGRRYATSTGKISTNEA